MYFDILSNYAQSHPEYGVQTFRPAGKLAKDSRYSPYSIITIKALSSWADAIAGVNCKVRRWAGYQNKIYLAFKSHQSTSNARASIQLCSYAFNEDLWGAVLKNIIPPLEEILGKGKSMGSRTHYYIWEYPDCSVPVKKKIDEIVEAILGAVLKDSE